MVTGLFLGESIWHRPAWALAAALLALPGAAESQTFRCAALQPSRSQQPAYQLVPGQARCEGFFDSQVSQPFIELVSLTRGAPQSPTVTAPTAMQITASRKVPARLIVHPLRPGPFYRVDALIDPSRALLWDAAPMLSATGLKLRDLGFLALAPSARDDTMTVLPLALTPAATPPLMLQAVLRVSVPVQSLSWRRYRLDGSDAAGIIWHDIDGPPRFAWDRVPLAFEFPIDGKPMRVDVQARDAAGRILPLLRFIVIGPDDAGS